MYWSPGEILPYQRTFNFVNSVRAIGKTYGMLKWLIKESLKGRQFVYIVRTQDEKKNGVLKDALAKVLDEQYPELEIVFTDSAALMDNEVLAHCIALTEAIKIKRKSFPKVWYILMDEYSIEDGTARYVNGFQEPELFITIYDTIDRRAGRVKAFFMGNNTSYYNPYHLYPLFGLPPSILDIPDKGIFKNKLTLFQLAQPSEALLKKWAENSFVQGLTGTRYGEYAVSGIYRDDRYQPIKPLEQGDVYRATVHTPEGVFGCYTNPRLQTLTFSGKVDLNYRIAFSLTKDGYREGYTYINPAYDEMRRLFRYAAYNQQVFYESMTIKAKLEPYLLKII